MTSLLRAEVMVPIAGSASATITSCPATRDRARDPQPHDARTDDQHLHCNRSEMNGR